MSSKILELLRLYRLYLLPLDCDENMRKRIEGSIVQALIDQGGLIGDFQEPDYRYQKPKSDGDHFRVELHCSAPILGLFGELIV